MHKVHACWKTASYVNVCECPRIGLEGKWVVIGSLLGSQTEPQITYLPTPDSILCIVTGFVSVNGLDNSRLLSFQL